MLTRIKFSWRSFSWIFLVLLLLAIGLWYWRYTIYYPSTDDAYVQANIVNVAAQVTGPVTSINVQDHEQVKKGTLLFKIDPASFQLAVQTAAAIVLQRQAELSNIQGSTERTLILVSKKLLPKANADEANMQLNVAQAALIAAQKQLGQAALNLQHTDVIAPADGTVTNFTLRVGTMVNAGLVLFAFVETAQWWVDANFKETDLRRIRVGQPATITTDIYPGHLYRGMVQGISLGSGAAFSLLPPENATGNWVKVTQRFPVRINIIAPGLAFPLCVGASSTVTINTH